MRTKEELTAKTLAARSKIMQARRDQAKCIADQMEAIIDAQVDAASEEGLQSTVIKCDPEHEDLLPEIIIALRALYQHVYFSRAQPASIIMQWD